MSESNQFSTFYIDKKLYGINVKMVQEITKAMPITAVPLAPSHVYGLINLRGQIATAIGMRDLFKFHAASEEDSKINVVCNIQGVLLSLVVDEVGDVLELDESLFENTPDTISAHIGQFMFGVFKLENELLSVIDLEKITEFLQQ